MMHSADNADSQSVSIQSVPDSINHSDHPFGVDGVNYLSGFNFVHRNRRAARLHMTPLLFGSKAIETSVPAAFRSR